MLLSGLGILKIFISFQALLVYEIIAVIVIFILFLKTRKKNKKYKEMISQQKNAYRELELDYKLSNEMYQEQKGEERDKRLPYETVYHEEEAVYLGDVVGVYIEEVCNLTTKKYVINLKDEVFAGFKDDNDIVINDELIGARQLRFVKNGNDAYIQSVDPICKVLLKRKKKKFQLGADAVKLMVGDVISLSDTKMTINIIE